MGAATYAEWSTGAAQDRAAVALQEAYVATHRAVLDAWVEAWADSHPEE